MSSLSSTYACFRLTRPVNGVIAAASVLVGVFVAGGDITEPGAILAGLSGWLLCAGANVLNDCCDIEIDRQNKPMRPLVTGGVSRGGAMGLAVLLNMAGIGIGVAVGPYHAGIAVFAVLGTTLYNVGLKRHVVVGNIMASGVASLAFIYGGLLGPRPMLALIPTVFAFFFHLGREILKDIEDMTGDLAGHVRSVPVRYGVRQAQMTVTAAFAILIPVTVLPYFTAWYGPGYLALVTLVDLIILYVLWSMWRDTRPVNAGRLSRILKTDMVIGLIAICLGR